MTPTGVLLGENQAIRGIDRQGIRLRIVGQQAGIDCDAAAKAVAVPIASDQAGEGPVDRLLMTTSQCKTPRFESAANGRLSKQLVVVSIEKPWPYAEAGIASQLPGYRRWRSGQTGPSRMYRSDAGVAIRSIIMLRRDPHEDFTHEIWPRCQFYALGWEQVLYRD